MRHISSADDVRLYSAGTFVR